MTGLEKMVSQIVDEATDLAKTRIADAQGQAAKIAAEAATEAEKLSENISRQSESDTANYMERIKSSADLQRRTAILKAKQEVIADVLEKAYASLNNLSEEEYFDMIRKMLNSFTLASEGDIYFSSADLKRLPAGFEKEIEEIAAKKGGVLRLAKESKNIESGFVLVYGGIEENCTFKALFSTQKDDLQDKAHKVLFS